MSEQEETTQEAAATSGQQSLQDLLARAKAETNEATEAVEDLSEAMEDMQDAAALSLRVPDIPTVPVTKYQHYTCSRPSMRMITTKGKRIAFKNFNFHTADTDIIVYLDESISSGLREVTKGELLTKAEFDPIEKMRAEIREEERAKLLEEAAAAELKASQSSTGILGSKQVQNAAGSTSNDAGAAATSGDGAS